MYLTLIPAYGRDYKSGKDAAEAFDAGVDWVICNAFHPHDGRCVSKSDLSGYTVNLRYKQLRNIKVVKVK
jgi:hypothetical protein